MELERAPRSELLKTIEQQKELIQRREQRLRDVISAYKGVVKEKEALESSVKVLSQSKAKPHVDAGHNKGPPSDIASDRESDRESHDGTRPAWEDHTDTESDQNKVGKETNELDQLRAQVQTLSSSMLTLTQEKSKLESSYIAEKKAIKQENDDLQKKVSEMTDRLAELNTQVNTQAQQWKKRIREQQLDLEREQTDHAVMLRELQKLVATERQAKEQLEQQHDETLFSLKDQERLLPEIRAQHQQEVATLQTELERLRGQLSEEKDRAEKPSPLLLHLQKQTDELKAEHSRLLEEDSYRAETAQVKAQEYSRQCETRIAELEEKLSQLSDSVGNYERSKFQDQQAIQKLKARVSQLEEENTALTSLSSQTGAEHEVPDIPTLLDRLAKLKSQLRLANSTAQQPVNIEEVLLEGLESEHPLVRKYREELEQVRDEFERYRLRAQSVLKNKKECPPAREDEMLRDHVTELREKLRSLHMEHEHEIDEYRQREENLRRTITVVQDKHKQEVGSIQMEHQSQLQELEEELRKQRERTVSMLAEREHELERLRSSSTTSLHSDYLIRLRSSQDMTGASSERESSEEAVTQLLTAPPSGQADRTLLYFAQEQARKDVDISALRKQKRELETSLRDLQLSSGTRQEQLHEQMHKLKEEIRKLERSISREGANLEYLKNVTYKFLICSDPIGKQQMLNAITTILQFSPQEKASVQAQNKGWWSGTT